MIPNLEQTFRWFGPDDPVTLQAINQTGATGVVSALHHIVWQLGASKQRADMITNRTDIVGGRKHIHKDIKTGALDVISILKISSGINVFLNNRIILKFTNHV